MSRCPKQAINPRLNLVFLCACGNQDRNDCAGTIKEQFNKFYFAFHYFLPLGFHGWGLLGRHFTMIYVGRHHRWAVRCLGVSVTSLHLYSAGSKWLKSYLSWKEKCICKATFFFMKWTLLKGDSDVGVSFFFTSDLRVALMSIFFLYKWAQLHC